MPGLITMVNDNHVDKYLKEILAFVHYGSIVKNLPKNEVKIPMFQTKLSQCCMYMYASLSIQPWDQEAE